MSELPKDRFAEYKIVDVDYFENDAILEIEGFRFFFQWDALEHPTLNDALTFLNNELKGLYRD